MGVRGKVGCPIDHRFRIPRVQGLVVSTGNEVTRDSISPPDWLSARPQYHLTKGRERETLAGHQKQGMVCGTVHISLMAYTCIWQCTCVRVSNHNKYI